MADSETKESNNTITSVKYWLETTIIGHNFCPFAKHEFVNNRVHYEVVDELKLEEQLHALANEFQRMEESADIATTLVILPIGLESFFDYLDFLDLANQLLLDQGFEGIFQLASFHPDYCFEDATHSDAANYTNRSPFPLVHVLRESSVERAIQSHPDIQAIPERNIEHARAKGAEFFQAILQKSRLE